MRPMRFGPNATRDYQTQRWALLLLVCGVTEEPRCHHCGCLLTAENMEFDHEGTRDWEPRTVNVYTRLRTYYREWIAAGAVVGRGIRGSCDSCNSRTGAHRAYGTYGTPGKKSATSAGKRRRGPRGVPKGYHAGLTKHYRDQRDREAAEVPF